MPYPDLRAWIVDLEKLGELTRVSDEVDWNLEVGAIVRRVYDLKAPAPLFERIKDYGPGYRILGAPIGLSARNRYARLAIALDLPPSAGVRDIVETYIARKKRLIPPQIVSDAPCQENVHLGEDVDLYQFPAPFIHEGDGGRYLCTWHSTISKDPDTGYVNYGMYRGMIQDRSHMGVNLGGIQHFMKHLESVGELGGRLEFAIALGTEPVTPLVTATPVPYGVSEAEVIGALRGEPLEVVKCLTVDLHVPSTSEIVIEGFVDPKVKAPEGPHGEYTGYTVSGQKMRYVYSVTAITHRTDPILPMSCMGVPVDDASAIQPITAGAEILEQIRDVRGLPVNFLYIVPEATGHFCAVSTKVPNSSYPQYLAANIWSTKAGRLYCNYLMIADEDVDVTDLGQVMWALATRVHPTRDMYHFDRTYVSSLVPWATPEERVQGIGASVLLDATWSPDWPKDWIPKVSSFEQAWPAEVQETVRRRWREYGFPSDRSG